MSGAGTPEARARGGIHLLTRMCRVAPALAVLGVAGCGGGGGAVAPRDGAPADAPQADGPLADAPGLDTPRPDGPPAPPDAPRDPDLLSSRGLYADIRTKTLAPDLLAFEPAHRLWSDAADKRRWVRLPPGTTIDTSTMDHWQLPVGTQLWKEFSLGGVLLETRLIERTGPGREDYTMGAFVWRADQADAVWTPAGASDVNGTPHDVPEARFCTTCHAGEPGRALGLSALQLHGSPALDQLVADGRLSRAPAAGEIAAVPGTPEVAAALGYLHANCGHCHNPMGTSWPDTQMVLRLSVGERDPLATQLYLTTVGQALTRWQHAGVSSRITPGMPDRSGVLLRMEVRGSRDQMPPLATEVVDPAGVAAVRAWISSLR